MTAVATPQRHLDRENDPPAQPSADHRARAGDVSAGAAADQRDFALPAPSVAAGLAFGCEGKGAEDRGPVSRDGGKLGECQQRPIAASPLAIATCPERGRER